MFHISSCTKNTLTDPLLDALTNTELPCVLIACKTDIAEEYRQVSSSFQDQIRRCFANVAIFETAKNEPEGHKRCLLSMLNQHLGTAKGASARAEQTRRLILCRFEGGSSSTVCFGQRSKDGQRTFNIQRYISKQVPKSKSKSISFRTSNLQVKRSPSSRVLFATSD